MRLLLASSSPRRQSLLKALGFDLIIAHPNVDEFQMPNEGAVEMASRLAQAKVQSVQEPIDIPCLAADTLVLLGDEILGKPTSPEHAKEMLQKLSGRGHEVITAFAVRFRHRVKTGLVRTKVTFRPLSEAEIEAYTRTKEPMDKAGAYAVQGPVVFVDEIFGSYTNVIGLPLKEVLDMLKDSGSW